MRRLRRLIRNTLGVDVLVAEVLGTELRRLRAADAATLAIDREGREELEARLVELEERTAKLDGRVYREHKLIDEQVERIHELERRLELVIACIPAELMSAAIDDQT